MINYLLQENSNITTSGLRQNIIFLIKKCKHTHPLVHRHRTTETICHVGTIPYNKEHKTSFRHPDSQRHQGIRTDHSEDSTQLLTLRKIKKMAGSKPDHSFQQLHHYTAENAPSIVNMLLLFALSWSLGLIPSTLLHIHRP